MSQSTTLGDRGIGPLGYWTGSPELGYWVIGLLKNLRTRHESVERFLQRRFGFRANLIADPGMARAPTSLRDPTGIEETYEAVWRAGTNVLPAVLAGHRRWQC